MLRHSVGIERRDGADGAKEELSDCNEYRDLEDENENYITAQRTREYWRTGIAWSGW